MSQHIENIELPWDDTSFVVMSHDGRMNPDLRVWLEGHHIEPEVVATQHHFICDRNATVEFFLTKSRTARLCMIDADMSPLPETMGILTAPGDLVYCGYSAKHGGAAHYGDGDLGMGCMRASREVLAAIPGRWFDIQYNERGTQVAQCECLYFLGKAQAAGFDSVMVGVIGHVMPMIARPHPDDHAKTQVLNPERHRLIGSNQ